MITTEQIEELSHAEGGRMSYVEMGKASYRKAVEDSCRAVCFHCRNEVPIQQTNANIWMHVFEDASGKPRMREACKANNIRPLLD